MSQQQTQQVQQKPKLRDRYRASYITNTGAVYEAVYSGEFSSPQFLRFVPSLWFQYEDHIDLPTTGERILPVRREVLPYKPYIIPQELLKKKPPDDTGLFLKVLSEYEKFLDMSLEYKYLETIQTFETYVQRRLTTTSYLHHEGDNESGKTRALEVHAALDYRPLFSPSLPAADVYGFLGLHGESGGTILEDEIQDMGIDREKMKIYRAGYRKGQTVPRTSFNQQGNRKIEFYPAFCSKGFAGTGLPWGRWAKGFEQRCITIHMIEGNPHKDEIGEEDMKMFSEIKAELLLWGMRHSCNPLPEVQVSMRRRVKELWKPKLQVAYKFAELPKVYEALEDLAEEGQRQKIEAVKNSLEGKVCQAFLRAMDANQIATVGDIWTELENVLGQKAVDGKITTDELPPISKRLLGLRLTQRLSAEKCYVDHERGYRISKEDLQKLTAKYHTDD